MIDYALKLQELKSQTTHKLKEIGGSAFANPPYSRSSYHEFNNVCTAQRY